MTQIVPEESGLGGKLDSVGCGDVIVRATMMIQALGARPDGAGLASTVASADLSTNAADQAALDFAETPRLVENQQMNEPRPDRPAPCATQGDASSRAMVSSNANAIVSLATAPSDDVLSIDARSTQHERRVVSDLIDPAPLLALRYGSADRSERIPLKNDQDRTNTKSGVAV